MKTRPILFALAVALGFASCNYDTITDADYPAQRIYLAAAAAGNIYTIESIPSHSSNTPTPGSVFQFTVDRQANTFNIPLSIYRAGIDNDGEVVTRVAFNSDTVNSLITSGLLPDVTLIPADKCSMPAEVRMEDGLSHATFNVSIDLDYLAAQAPTSQLAFGLNITESSREVNHALDALIVVIDTKIMKPSAQFTFQVDADAWNRIHFTNRSENIVASQWQFGDDSSSDETNPTHTYEAGGTYEVTLTTTGILGDQETSRMEVQIIQVELLDRSGWSIAGFSTEEPAEGNGNGLAAAAIDGNIDTYWHTQWSGATPGYPHYLIVDMGALYTVASVQCIRRQGDNRGQTECQILLSTDQSEWIDCGTFPVADTDDPQTFTLTSYEKARYIKYVATKGNNHFAFLAEISAYGSKE